MGKVGYPLLAAIMLGLAGCSSSMDSSEITSALPPVETTPLPRIGLTNASSSFCTAAQIEEASPVFVEASPAGALKAFGCLPFAERVEVAVASGMTEQLEAIHIDGSGQLLMFTRSSPQAETGSIYAVMQQEITGDYGTNGILRLNFGDEASNIKVANASRLEVQALGFSLGVLPDDALVYATLSSVPSGADIYVASQWLGMSELTGHLLRQAIDQTYFRMAGYRDCHLEQATQVFRAGKTNYLCELLPEDAASDEEGG